VAMAIAVLAAIGHGHNLDHGLCRSVRGGRRKRGQSTEWTPHGNCHTPRRSMPHNRRDAGALVTQPFNELLCVRTVRRKSSKERQRRRQPREPTARAHHIRADPRGEITKGCRRRSPPVEPVMMARQLGITGPGA